MLQLIDDVDLSELKEARMMVMRKVNHLCCQQIAMYWANEIEIREIENQFANHAVIDAVGDDNFAVCMMKMMQLELLRLILANLDCHLTLVHLMLILLQQSENLMTQREPNWMILKLNLNLNS